MQTVCIKNVRISLGKRAGGTKKIFTEGILTKRDQTMATHTGRNILTNPGIRAGLVKSMQIKIPAIRPKITVNIVNEVIAENQSEIEAIAEKPNGEKLKPGKDANNYLTSSRI